MFPVLVLALIVCQRGMSNFVIASSCLFLMDARALAAAALTFSGYVRMRKNDFDSAISERSCIASGEPMTPRAIQIFSSRRVRAAVVTNGRVVSISRRSGTMSAAFALPSASMRLSLNFASAPGNAVISNCPLRFPPVREILFKASCRSRSFS